MNAHPTHTVTSVTILAWAEAQPKEAVRFEFWDGEGHRKARAGEDHARATLAALEH